MNEANPARVRFRFRLATLFFLMSVVASFLAGRTSHELAIDELRRLLRAERKVHTEKTLRILELAAYNHRVNHARRRIVDILSSRPTFEVVEVVDGATIRVSMDGISTVKLKGVGRPFGYDAKVYTSFFCSNPVWIIERERDSEGNIIAIVVSSRGDIINDELIRAGLARPDREHKNQLGILETMARKSKQGMWAAFSSGRTDRWFKSSCPE